MTRSRILDHCDALLEEVGRREHRFAWLRDDRDWLVVDVYYPRARLVVCCERSGTERQLCEELIPQHGLGLLCLDPAEVAENPALLRDKLDSVAAPAPRPSPKPAAAAPPPARPRRQAGVAEGLGFGVILIVIVLLEAYLGLVRLAADDGDVVLGFGLVLDAAARVLGSMQARQRWSCLLGGSPQVARLAFDDSGQDGPARETGVLALVACAAVVLGLLLAA